MFKANLANIWFELQKAMKIANEGKAGFYTYLLQNSRFRFFYIFD